MKRCIFLFVWIIFCYAGGFLASFAEAFSYHPENPIVIVTEPATEFAGETAVVGRVWRVEAESDPVGDGNILSFFSEDTGERLCRMTISPSGVVIDADISGMSANMMFQEKDLLIVPGYPMPCDILPTGLPVSQTADEAGEVYQVRRSVGSRSVATSLGVKSYTIPREIVLSRGWITESTRPDHASFRVIEVVNLRTNEIQALQIWATGDDWWLYEQTPVRRSRRLF